MRNILLTSVLTTGHSESAGFIGDPNFAAKLGNENISPSKRIHLCEDLYKRYSRLTLSHKNDRPFAIAGLERRLLHSLSAKGGFGLFDDGHDLLPRSLLWKLGKGFSSLIRLSTDGSTYVPSWSWMAYDGGIDFVKVPFGTVEWFPHAVQSPWASDTCYKPDGQNSPVLKAQARPLALDGGEWTAKIGIKIICDNQKSTKIRGEDLMVVVLGKDKECRTVEEATHLVLVITTSGKPLCAKRAKKVYERVGVGRVKGRWLSPGSLEQTVTIC